MADGLLELLDLREGQDNADGERPAPAHAFPPSLQRKPYNAFRIKPKVPRLKIHFSGKGRHALPYFQLADVVTNEEETESRLFFRSLIVRICGRNISELIAAIEDHRCELIRDFNPRIFAAPDATQPIIDRIEFLEEVEEPETRNQKPKTR